MNGDKMAFPMPEDINNAKADGLTKREYAAIAAMQGLLASDNVHMLPAATVAGWAREHADALLAELEGTQKT